jgi:hypothetical protein
MVERNTGFNAMQTGGGQLKTEASTDNHPLAGLIAK